MGGTPFGLLERLFKLRRAIIARSTSLARSFTR
jgi:hypothetical protein